MFCPAWGYNSAQDVSAEEAEDLWEALRAEMGLPIRHDPPAPAKGNTFTRQRTSAPPRAYRSFLQGKMRSHPLKFSAACFLSVVFMLTSIWKNDDEGGLT
jgi:hypothetical protein